MTAGWKGNSGAFFDDALASGGALVDLDAASGEMIGSSRFGTNRAEPGEVEIGWTFLARSHWSGTANAAMKAVMVGHALNHFDQVMFLIGATNIRSRRAMEKIGGVLTDRVETAEIAGQPVDHVSYAIDRAGLAAGPPADIK